MPLHLLAHDLFRFLVAAEPLERRMADFSVARPLGEDHLAYQVRLDPVDRV